MKTFFTVRIFKYLFFSLILAFLSPRSFPQTRRALLIGINTYKATKATESAIIKSRSALQNLDGCLNDVCAIQSIIWARYGFEEKNIDTLCNTNANRENILKYLKQLEQRSKKGDIVLIYYSGHGSLVTNSKSVHPDKRDQSIVPSDLIDIRDKEMAVYFNNLADRGVTLTLIFDNCHSGSIARGSIPDVLKSRKVAENPVDAQDPSDLPNPEDKGVLVFSACQPDESAYETFDDKKNSRGAFTYALCQVLESSPVNESAGIIFMKTKAILQQQEIKQEPVIGGTSERKEKGLFGEPANLTGKTVVPVLAVLDRNTVILQGGQALNLNRNCTLIKAQNNDTVRLIVGEVLGLNRCEARTENTTTEGLKSGDLFTLEKWTSADKPVLTIYYPDNQYTYEEIIRIAGTFINILASLPGITLVKNPALESPTHYIQYYRNKWLLTFSGENKEIDLGAVPDYKLVSKNLQSGSKVFIQLPPPKELTASIEIGKNSYNTAIEKTSEPRLAQYFLVGRYNGDSLQYALINPVKNANDGDYLSTMPVCTDWIDSRLNCGERLTEYALRLGKIRGWLSLQPPADDGTFPFTLGLKNLSTQKFVRPGDVVYENDKIEVFLLIDKEKMKSWDIRQQRRYVYIFVIDSTGKMTQIFPQNNINYGNRLPNSFYNNETEIPLGVRFRITIPFGRDTYFMITSKEVITAYQAFNSSGVITRGSLKSPGSSDNALTKLLNNIGTSTRGEDISAPTSWSLEKFTVVSKPKRK